MSTTADWAQALKRDGYELVPDSATLQQVATKYSLNKSQIGMSGFRETLTRQLEAEWKKR